MTTMPTFAVQIRSKTIERLGLKENFTAQNKLVNAIICFRDWSYAEAFKTIFAFVYGSQNSESFLHHFGFTASQELTDTYMFLNDEQIVHLSNELKYQYKQSRPKFLEVKDNPGYQEELDELKKAMRNDPLLLYKVVENCQNCHQSSDIITPSVRLLMSESADLQKRGLHRLGYNSQYQELLLPHAKKIGILLEAMYNWHEEQKRIMAAQEELNKFPSPFNRLSDMLKQKQSEEKLAEKEEACSDVPCDAPHNGNSNELPAEPADKIPDNFSKYSLSDELSKFIKNKSEIVRNLPRDDEFWSCLKRLRDLGINLNALVDNELYLWPILEAHDNLDEAIAELYDAEQAFKEAQKNFNMGDFETIQVLFKSGKARENAKVSYNYAFDAFIAHCKAYEEVVKK